MEYKKYKTIFVDIDDTICYYNENIKNNYNLAKPNMEKIKIINSLYDVGYIIIYWTARGTITNIDWREITENQLKEWGCKYNELHFKKPAYDIFIDDKNINSDTFFNNLLDKTEYNSYGMYMNKSITDIIKKDKKKLTNTQNKDNYEILCIIPARSGSKSLPHKNIKSFSGMPLLAWSIKQAQQCKLKMRIIVSTDSQKYATIAREWGAETPFLRPNDISQDLSTDLECIQHAVTWLKENENYYPDIILQLRPTQPLRKVEDINKCLDIFIKNRSKYDSLRTVVEFDKSPYKMYNIKDDKLEPLFSSIDNIKEPYNQCRQILPKTYLHNGYIDILNTDILEFNTISGNVIYPYIMNKYDTIDIDTQEDWNRAEKTVCNEEKDKLFFQNDKEFYVDENGYITLPIKFYKLNNIYIYEAEIINKLLNSNDWNNDLFDIIINNNYFVINLWKTNNDSKYGYCKISTNNIELNTIKVRFHVDKYKKMILSNHNIINTHYLSYFTNKKIIVVGNGNNGFVKNISNKYIDDHDIVIRINSYKLVPEISGIKTDIHFMGSTVVEIHKELNEEIYPIVNQGEYILCSNGINFLKRLFKILQNKSSRTSEIIKFDTKKVDNIMKNIIGSNTKAMSGPYILIILYWISTKTRCTIDYIGFGSHKLIDSKQSYYWGSRKLSDKQCISHNNHKFNKQYIFINLIKSLKTHRKSKNSAITNFQDNLNKNNNRKKK